MEDAAKATTAVCTCASCGKADGAVAFSKSQRKKQKHNQEVRCKECLEALDAVAAVCNAKIMNDDDDDEADDTKNDSSKLLPASLLSPKDEKKRLKKEAKRAQKAHEKATLSKKERKQLKKERKEAKRQRKAAKKKTNSSSSSSSSACSSKNSNSQDKEATKFSDHESDAQFSEDGAQFSDTETPAKNPTPENALQIPRKRKKLGTNDEENNNKSSKHQHISSSSSSLIANLKPAPTSKPKSKSNAIHPSESIMMMDEDAMDDEVADFRDVNHAEEDEEPGFVANVSVRALKQRVLGRQIRTAHEEDDDDDNNNHDDDEYDSKLAAYTTTQKVSPALRSELTCAICHELFLNPVSLLCGHSFCQECVNWWWQSLGDAQHAKKNCPTCRRDIPIIAVAGTKKNALGVNTALRACVMALVGEELQGRLQAAKEAGRRTTKGEHGGAHDRGYEVMTALDEDPWRAVATGSMASWPCRRSIVVDAEDQRMQLALGIWKDATTSSGIMYSARAQSLQVSLCLLTMEEDEVADGGFPRVVDEEDDMEDNEQLLVSRHGGRFVHSFVRAVAKGNHDTGDISINIPLGRWGIQATGVVEMALDLSQAEREGATMISLEHEETGVTLELKMAEGNFGTRSIARDRIGGRGAIAALDEDDEEERHLLIAGEEEADDGSHLDKFESDGFIADEADDIEVDDEHYGEDDVCDICNKGGVLMVCDGGDYNEGCGRSVHIKCVRRDVIPAGDWICQHCANDVDMEVGIEGHEFPADIEMIHDTESEASPIKKRKPKRLNKSKNATILLDDSDGDESAGGEPGSDGSAKSAQRHIGGDSDDDEEKDKGDLGSDRDEAPGFAAKKPSKRVLVIESDDDE